MIHYSLVKRRSRVFYDKHRIIKLFKCSTEMWRCSCRCLFNSGRPVPRKYLENMQDSVVQKNPGNMHNAWPQTTPTRAVSWQCAGCSPECRQPGVGWHIHVYWRLGAYILCINYTNICIVQCLEVPGHVYTDWLVLY